MRPPIASSFSPAISISIDWCTDYFSLDDYYFSFSFLLWLLSDYWLLMYAEAFIWLLHFRFLFGYFHCRIFFLLLLWLIFALPRCHVGPLWFFWCLIFQAILMSCGSFLLHFRAVFHFDYFDFFSFSQLLRHFFSISRFLFDVGRFSIAVSRRVPDFPSIDFHASRFLQGQVVFFVFSFCTDSRRADYFFFDDVSIADDFQAPPITLISATPWFLLSISSSLFRYALLRRGGSWFHFDFRPMRVDFAWFSSSMPSMIFCADVASFLHFFQLPGLRRCRCRPRGRKDEGRGSRLIDFISLDADDVLM